MSFTRRVFLRNGALAAVGTAALPSFLTRAAYGAADPGTRPMRLVVIFQRGAADGLNIVVPHGESAYYAMRLVLSEVVSRYLGNKDLKTVFPGFEGQSGQFLKLLG
jgi:uncharacterized protein (DUF1501 family)